MSEKSEFGTKQDEWKATVETLQKFYSVIVALALTGGLVNLISSWGNAETIASHVSIIAIALSFLVTIVPFFHGMERHLYKTHITYPELGAGGKPTPLLVDIFTFIIEGSILFMMGSNLNDPEIFLRFWSALLAVDMVWSLIVWGIQRGPSPLWARNNLIWLCIAWLVWIGLQWNQPSSSYPSSSHLALFACVFALIEIGRSATDYLFYWSLYFPDEHRRSSHDVQSKVGAP
jgi:hypothetical protein